MATTAPQQLLTKTSEFRFALWTTVSRLQSHLAFRMALFFLLLLLRSHPRLFHPQVWDEDGAPNHGGSNILDFVNYGARGLFKPVNGYLLLLPKGITAAALSVSFSHYNLISTILAWIVIVLILVLVTSRRTELRGGIWLGALALLVPTDTEVFGLPLYTFWWATLLLFAVILWKKNSTDLRWRLPMVFVAGLSTPAIIGTAPVFLLRAYVYRRTWQEWAVSLSALFCSGLQLLVYARHTIRLPSATKISLSPVLQVVPAFFGRYLIGNIVASSAVQWIAGIGLAVLLMAVLLLRRRSFTHWSLVLLLIISLAMSMYRADIGIIHPALAGPRYFFLPFVLLSWLLLDTVVAGRIAALKVVSLVLLLLSIANAVPVLTRKHDDLHWRDHVISCPFFANYSIPVQYDGHADTPWPMPLAGAQCRGLLDRDLFRSTLSHGPTFPYAVLKFHPEDYPMAAATLLQNGTGGPWLRAGWELDHVSVFRRSETSPAEPHKITFQLHRGDLLIYRSAQVTSGQRVLIDNGKLPFLQPLPPRSMWVLLEFSSVLLPDNFSVTFLDSSNNPSEWLAIGPASANEIIE